jgi:hypothetical protein
MKKKYAANLKLFFWDLKHYAAKLIFDIFRKKKWPHFSKMDILKMSNFGKHQHKFIQLFLVGTIFVGNKERWWELYLWEFDRIQFTKFLCI